MDGLHPLDWLAVLGYLGVALASGTWLSRRAARSMVDFYLAGRSLPWWVSGTSLVATSFAADTPLLVTGYVRTQGIQGNWLWWGFAVGGSLWFAFLAAWWRRLPIMTNAEFAELRYSGVQARALRGFYGAYHALITNTIVLIWVFLAMVKVTRAALGIADPAANQWIVAGALAVALLYSVMAGLWGVVITDVFQFVLCMAGAVLLAWKAVGAAGGLEQLVGELHERFPERLAFFPEPGAAGAVGFWTQGLTAFLVSISVLSWINKNADGSGQAIQRFLAARNENHARGAALWFQLAHYCLRSWPWILAALASLVLLHESELPLLQADPPLPDHEAAYPVLMRKLLGPGLFGVMCASFLAAFMSTVDTHFNTASAYLVNDVYRRFLRPNAAERHYVLVGRLAVVAVGALGAGLTFWADSIDRLFRLSLTLVAGLGPALLLRWFWWRANAWTEISGLACSTVLALLFQYGVPAPWWPAAPFNGWRAQTPWDFSGQYLLSVALSTAVMLIVTLATPPVARDHLQRFHRLVQPFGWWGPLRQPGAAATPRRALLACWGGGLALTYGLMIGLGKALLGGTAWPWFGAAGAGGLLLWWSWDKSVAPGAQEPVESGHGNPQS